MELQILEDWTIAGRLLWFKKLGNNLTSGPLTFITLGSDTTRAFNKASLNVAEDGIMEVLSAALNWQWLNSIYKPDKCNIFVNYCWISEEIGNGRGAIVIAVSQWRLARVYLFFPFILWVETRKWVYYCTWAQWRFIITWGRLATGGRVTFYSNVSPKPPPIIL